MLPPGAARPLTLTGAPGAAENGAGAPNGPLPVEEAPMGPKPGCWGALDDGVPEPGGAEEGTGPPGAPPELAEC